MEKNASTNVLRIGDYVNFKAAKFGGSLCAEGILLQDLGVVETPKVFDDSLFCIHLQRQYSAAKELEEFLKKDKIDIRNIVDANTAKYYHALKRGADNESKLNDAYLKKALGRQVNFGDIIQLFHVKSGKYVKILPDQLAKDERENIRIVLDSSGNSFSWIQVCPRYKIDREGDRVLNSAEVLLKVAERSNEYIHRSDRPPLPGLDIEVNCSLEATSWQLNIFRSSVDSHDKNLLLSYELVYISDPETRCNLTLAPITLESLEGDIISLESSGQTEEDVEYFDTVDEFGEEHIPIRNPGFHEYGDAVLHASENHFSSDFLWFIETGSGLSGGPVKLKTDKVRFKHVNTGKYLKLETIRVRLDDEKSEERNVYTTTYDSSDPAIAFSLAEANNPGKHLQNAKALQIGMNGLWIERGPLENGNYIVKPTEDKSMAVNLFITRFVDVKESDSIIEENAETTSTEPLDAYVGMSIRGYLHKYLTMTKLPKKAAVNTVWPTANRSDMPFFQSMAKKVVLFSQGFPISAENVLLGIDKGNQKLKIRRQSLLREQGTVEVILRLINKLIPITERADEIKNLPKRRAPLNENELAALEMGRIVLSICFDLLYYSILDHSENQIYVADFLPVLLAHLSSQPMAGKCVTEMLSKNWELQETKISKREIKIFVDKLRSSKMNAMYLQLLQSCCSCEGNGVDGNQGKVADMLFEDTNDIIINLHADNNRSNKVSWIHSNLYIPTGNVPGSPIRADFLITKGLPKLSLAWTTNSIDFSPLGLFGKLSVGIEDLFGLQSELQISAGGDSKAAGAIAKKNKGKKNSLDQKRAVANYFIAEMFLGAEMCMDRNYISMHILDPMFPYEVLITLLKMELSHDIKSAAVRLLMCLHIDRDPQAATKIPILTRAWSDIEKNPEPKLPCVEAGRYYTFGLLQQLISEHVQAMAGIPWDDLSRHMLRMLRTLVEFNFYGTNDRMKDVIEPLITALDRRSISMDETIVQRLSSKNVQMTMSPSSSVENLPSLNNNNETRDDVEAGASKTSPSKSGTLSSMVATIKSKLSAAQDAPSEDDGGNSDTLGAVKKYSVPTRYAKAPMYELETMVEMVDILAFAQKVIEDRNISLLMRYFYLWISGVDQRSPTQLFEQVMNDSRELTMDVANFDDVMIDTLMFEHNDLVQSALELLMAHHSKRLTLLNNLYDLQLLASPGRERQFRIVDAMLKQLEQNAETQELWGELESDADRAINNQTIDILKELIDICRIRQSKIDIEDENGDDDFRPDPAIQDLYRNLNCFVITQKVLGLLDSVEEEEDGSISDAGLNTKNLCRLCNELLYWFFLGNKKNQDLGYSDLDFFIETLDKGINSHRVIRAIFSNNEFLMRQVPHSYLNDLVNMIITNGKSHHYLTLLTAITHVGDKNIYENQLEICKTLTSPGPLQKVSCYFVPIDHPEYEEKRALMKPYLNSERDVPLEELPSLLSYHLMFLEVLSGCTVGSKNMTTIEAKVQSVYNYEHILQSILDPGTIIICKICLSRFFFNSVIEVDLKIPGLEQSQEVWKLLESYRPVLTQAFEQVEKVTKLGWDAPGVSKQKLQYVVICIMIISGFFEFYYQVAQFQPDDREGAAAGTTVTASKPGKVNFTLTHVDELIIFFFTKIKEIYDYDSPKFADSTKKMMYKALQTLNTRVSGENTIVTFIKPPHQLGIKETKNVNGGDEDEEDETDYEMAHDPEKDLLVKFKEFQRLLKEDNDILYKADNENVAFIRILESLPYIADPVAADVRYETLIKKLVFHIRENIKMVNNQKRMDARVTATSTWIIRAFRTMIENRMGMSIYERDEEGGEEQDLNAAPVVNALNTCGGTALCLDLIADGIDEKLQLEAIKLGVGLLFKEGGALEVQGIMNAHLSQTNSELFFRQVRLTLQKLQAWHEWNGYEKQQTSEEPLEPPKEILIVRFLQLMCEGHYLPNQDIMREQPNNRVSYNLLDDLVNYLNFLSSTTPCQIDVEAAVRVSATILEVIQGPCVGNQTHFTLNTELVETLNRINRRRLENDCHAWEEIELKKTSIDIFQGLLEGQGEKSVIYERVLSVIHLDIILSMSNGAILQGVDGEEKGGDDDESKEEKEVLKTECVVLLQMLRNFKPSLAQELGISENLEDIVGSGTAMIEVVWRGEVQPRFFHIPQICRYLATSSRDNLVENVDRTNPENKLVDFLNRAHELYLEVKHQEFLTKQNLSRVFSRENQNRATWITFYLAMAINIILLLSYTAEGSEAKVHPQAAMAVSILNIIQAIVAGFVLILFLVVRIPVKYQSLQKQGYSEYQTWLYTAMEPMTLYYIWYLTFSILGQVVSYDFLPFLLMDIVVKNSTTRDVLNAVIYPRRQIMMGGIVILIIVQIYTFFLFLYFRNEILPQGRQFCKTFWGCYRATLGYGLRSGGGVGDIFEVSLRDRWVLDITFYVAITVGMLNLIAGVIITTFGQLRENKARRMEDTVGVCFICGIDKQVFDRASDKPEGFTTHVKLDHNMWNYLYFIFLLWEQDKDDDDGLEQYVRRAIDANDIAWFPMNKAIRLRQAATKEESMLMSLTHRVQQTETLVATRLERFNTDISIVLEQLNQVLKQDHVDTRSGESRAVKSRANVPLGTRNADASGLDKYNNMGKYGDDYDNDMSRPAYRQHSSTMYLTILDMHEVRLPPAANETNLQGVLEMGEETFNIPIEKISKTRVKFARTNQKLKLVENVKCDDDRFCEFRLVFVDPNSQESRSLVVVKISLEELYLAEGTLLEIYLDPPHAQHRRKIVVMSTIEKANI